MCSKPKGLSVSLVGEDNLIIKLRRMGCGHGEEMRGIGGTSSLAGKLTSTIMLGFVKEKQRAGVEGRTFLAGSR